MPLPGEDNRQICETHGKKFASIREHSRAKKSPPQTKAPSHHTGVGPCQLSATVRYRADWKVPANHANHAKECARITDQNLGVPAPPPAPLPGVRMPPND